MTQSQTRENYVEPMATVGERTVINPIVDYHDRVRWGPILAGIVVAIAAQLILSALGVAIGLTASAGNAEADSVGIGVGVWSVIAFLIALFLGAWVTTASCGPMNNKTALLHGLLLWATTLTVGSWLLASGVSGTFGIVASSAGAALSQIPGGVEIPQQSPNVDPEAVARATAKIAWSFIIGSLLGLAASLIGASVGKRKPRTNSVRS